MKVKEENRVYFSVSPHEYGFLPYGEFLCQTPTALYVSVYNWKTEETTVVEFPNDAELWCEHGDFKLDPPYIEEE